MAARICACLLAASLIAADALPAFAAGGAGEPAAEKMRAMEEDVSGKEMISIEGTETGDAAEPEGKNPAQDIAGEGAGSQDAPESGKEPQSAPAGEESKNLPVSEEPKDAPVGEELKNLPVGEEPKDAPASGEPKNLPVSEEPKDAPVSEGMQNMPESQQGPQETSGAESGQQGTSEEASGLLDGIGTRQELFSIPEPKEGKEISSGVQENSSGLFYLDGKPYSGYYMDSSGILYAVTNGTAEPKTGTVAAGTEYYSNPSRKVMAFPAQSIFVAGKPYTGYCMDSAGILYAVANGIAEPETGTVDAGTAYYNFSASKTEVLPAQALFVEGKIYTGYYLGPDKKLYYAKKGACTLKTGSVKAGAKYYSSRAKTFLQVKKQTLYVKGNVYTGYYMSQPKKMYYVKKGTQALKTGMVKAGVKYYSYRAKTFLQVKKQALYVKGKVYTGFYMSQSKKMYQVKKGTRTLVTGMLKAGTKYYSYRAKKREKLPKQALYVKGKRYSGYYLDPENKMNSVKKGTCTLVNTALEAGTKYYSHKAKKTLALPQLTVYVYGKAMEGMSPESLATLQRAQAVVASITNEGMAKEEKLRACFEFVKTYKGGWPRTPHYTGMDWPVVYANDMFVNDGKGICFSYAAAFAYMAKAIGYEEVYACNSGSHGWAEIDGLIYDPERNKFDPSFHYYGISYDEKTKVDYKGGIAAGLPWMRVKI